MRNRAHAHKPTRVPEHGCSHHMYTNQPKAQAQGHASSRELTPGKRGPCHTPVLTPDPQTLSHTDVLCRVLTCGHPSAESGTRPCDDTAPHPSLYPTRTGRTYNPRHRVGVAHLRGCWAVLCPSWGAQCSPTARGEHWGPDVASLMLLGGDGDTQTPLFSLDSWGGWSWGQTRTGPCPPYPPE